MVREGGGNNLYGEGGPVAGEGGCSRSVELEKESYIPLTWVAYSQLLVAHSDSELRSLGV